MDAPRYEQYREKIRITEWRDRCIYATESLGCGWFTDDEINANLPSVTNLMYVAASDDFARNNMTIRRAMPMVVVWVEDKDT